MTSTRNPLIRSLKATRIPASITPAAPHRRVAAGLILAAGLIAATTHIAAAQQTGQPTSPPTNPSSTPVAGVRMLSPYVAVVIEDEAPLRAGWTDRHYRVAELAKGATIRVDGSHGEWLRVVYPKSIPAFVKPADASFNNDTNAITIVRPTRLKALNLRGGAAGSWRSLLTEPLPTGRTLTVHKVLVDDAGKVVGYVVVAPPSAHGYIHTKFLRRSDQPLADATDTTPPPDAPTDETDPPASDRASSSTTTIEHPVKILAAPQPGAEAPESGRAGTQPSGDNARADDSMLEPMIEPGTETTTPPASGDPLAGDQDPGANDAGSAIIDPSIAPPTDDNLPGVPSEDANQPTPVMSIEALDEAYHSMRQQSTGVSELDELLVQYRRAHDAASDEVFATRLRRQLAQRISMIELRIEYRDRVLTLASQREQGEENRAQLDSRMAQIEAQRSFDLVGWLVPSTIYNGQRLPMLYRLRSPDTLGRTLAYVRPDSAMKLPAKVGSLVGIRGAVALDSQLGVRIISPRTVQVVVHETANAGNDKQD